MSVLNQSGEEQVECPLCMEPLEVDDLHFYPCTCGYQICRFCWNRIREGENGLCPACRKAYPENPADFTPLSQEQVAAIKTEKKAREQKRRNKTLESRRALANVRVVQNNLVFVVGLPVRLADPEILKRQEYFGKYGKIHKVVINQSTTYAGSQGPSASAYVTYVSSADALRAIQGVNNVTLDGRVLKGSLGTTKYCANFMKNQPCPKPDCMYLHELGDPKASFTKEEMHAGLHQVYERKLHNQLLATQRDNTATNTNGSGNSSTNAEKGSSKDGNPSNYIPTTVVTSSHINVVNSSKSKKGQESMNGSVGSVGSSSSGSSKDAWPSLAPSSPTNSPQRKHSPKPDDIHNTYQAKVKSQENGTSESSSPIQLSQTTQPAPKSKDTESKPSRKDSTNGQNSKKNKDKKQKSNSITAEEQEAADKAAFNTHSVFENNSEYLSNELDELESDRHSLLENHDLLDNSDHSLLEDDTHNLLESNEMMMQRHREMLVGLDNHLMPHVNKSPLMNGFGLLDRDISYDRQINQLGGIEQKEMRHGDMLRHHNLMMDPKHYMPTSSIGLESASELLGANFHQNPNMLPFGMRVDNSIANNSMTNSMVNSLGANSMGNSLGGNTMGSSMGANTLGNSMGGNTLGNSMGGNSMGNSMGGNSMGNSMGGNSMGNSMGANTMGGSSMSSGPLGSSMGGFMLHNQPMMQQNQQMQSGLVNGFDNPQTASEGRYLDNMDKFFTDFHKAQQMRMLLQRNQQPPAHHHQQPYHTHNMLSAEALEMEHKQRMNSMRAESMGRCAAGDGDDDLDFDPFKETQKALAEMMETEMMQTTVSSGDNMERVRRSRAPPPGFGHLNTFNMPPPRLHPQDWTQMDPAIVSTSVFPKQQPGNMSNMSNISNMSNMSNMSNISNINNINNSSLSPQQQELFARFNQLSVQQPNGLNKIQVPLMQQWAQNNGNKLGWGYNSIPLPPGFAPAKPAPHSHAAECIDAK